ncbi:NFATC2-interacting protein isoform X5 [Phyllopteryx taeniolatus]|uniref:NFATC2-interacting protein isoform X5 n=1 Tax=Phyllopteryx taeniolatus TaxID=161469 RepID=UPI002AD27079|nr:NFATC2-interacting protein isoform X5 [Phyllopteryx taeniolatus]
MAEQGRKTVRQFWTPEDTQKLIKVTTDQEQDLMQPRFHGNQMWDSPTATRRRRRSSRRPNADASSTRRPSSPCPSTPTSSLRLKAELPTMMEKERTDDGDVANLWSQMARREGRALAITISDSDDEPEVKESPSRSPPPPPAEIPFRKQSRRSKMKIKEVDRRLRAVSAIFSPEAASTRRRQRDIPELDEHDDDVIVLDGRRSCDSQVLKVRCRTDVYKLPVTLTTSVGQMVSQMAAILGLSSFRLRLLREEAELPADASVGELGLDITDILECVVMATEEGAVITVRLQGKDRGSGRDFSVHKGAELGAIFSQYVAALPAATKRKVKFHFDGCKVTGRQTPAQLDMEDGDIIEVWT